MALLKKIWAVLKPMLKRWGWIGVVLWLAALMLMLCIRSPKHENFPLPPEPAALPELSFTMPLFDLPFRNERLPVDPAVLPIPPREVAKTVEIATPQGEVATVVIDREGRLYTTTDTPADTTVTVTAWKPPIAELPRRLSLSFVYSSEPYACLSADLVRLGPVYLGVELGTSIRAFKPLAGTSAKLIVLKAGGIELSAVAGRDWLGSRWYAGVNLGTGS